MNLKISRDLIGMKSRLCQDDDTGILSVKSLDGFGKPLIEWNDPRNIVTETAFVADLIPIEDGQRVVIATKSSVGCYGIPVTKDELGKLCELIQQDNPRSFVGKTIMISRLKSLEGQASLSEVRPC